MSAKAKKSDKDVSTAEEKKLRKQLEDMLEGEKGKKKRGGKKMTTKKNKGKKGTSSQGKNAKKKNAGRRVKSISKFFFQPLGKTTNTFVCKGKSEGNKNIVVEGKVSLWRVNDRTKKILADQKKKFKGLEFVGEKKKVDGHNYMYGIDTYTIFFKAEYEEKIKQAQDLL